MAATARVLLDLTLFGMFVIVFLGPVYLWASYRFRRACSDRLDRAYVPQADPWLRAVVALSGAGLIGLLHLTR